MQPKFSICIPNYNYGSYLEETIDSVLNQTYKDFEICIADNASTDNSWEVIQKYCNLHTNIKSIRNPINVGFAGNLDIVSSLAEGEWHIMLSSDDLMNENALEVYYNVLKDNLFNPNLLINSGFEQFENENPAKRFYVGFNKYIWQNHTKTADNNSYPIVKDTTSNLLRHGLERFVSPYNFVALCYSSELYKKVSGYGASRMMNPDRWFHWKLCTKADHCIFVDRPLFYYRWHNNNQTALQEKSGVLKFWIDEYRNCFELTSDHFNKSGLTKSYIENCFFNRVIVAYALSSLAYGFPLKALRLTAFGIFTYPNIFFKNLKSLFLLVLMIFYPFTFVISKLSGRIYGK
jgi:glycosyltransferase involved in cell wall biosynthesis